MEKSKYILPETCVGEIAGLTQIIMGTTEEVDGQQPGPNPLYPSPARNLYE